MCEPGETPHQGEVTVAWAWARQDEGDTSVGGW